MKIKNHLLLAVMLSCLQAGAQTSSSAVISCSIGDLQPNDTIRLLVWDENLSEGSAHNLPYRTLTTVNNKGTLRFVIDDLKHPVYFSLVKEKEKTFGNWLSFISQYLLEPGDDLHIYMDSLRPAYTRFYGETEDALTGYRVVGPRFTGKGAAKAEFTFLLDSNTNHWLQTAYTRKNHPHNDLPGTKYDSAYFASYPATMEHVYEDNKAILDFQLTLLDRYRKNMSEEAYQVIRTNLIGSMESADVRFYSLFKPDPNDTLVSADFKKHLGEQLRSIYDNRQRASISETPPSVLCLSKDYINFLTNYAFYLVPKGEEYAWLKEHYTSVFRDKLITDFLMKWFFYLKDSQEVLSDAELVVQSEFSRHKVNDIYNGQSVGRPAYNFTLPSVSGENRSLSDFRGKIVFIDLWYTGCGACSKFYRYQLSRLEEKYKNDPNVVFITISIDVDRQTWLKSVQSGYYTSAGLDNVVNLYTAGRGTEDPLIKAYNVTGYPHPFMIDRAGKIYRVNKLQAAAEDLIPVIDEAIAKNNAAK